MARNNGEPESGLVFTILFYSTLFPFLLFYVEKGAGHIPFHSIQHICVHTHTPFFPVFFCTSLGAHILFPKMEERVPPTDMLYVTNGLYVPIFSVDLPTFSTAKRISSSSQRSKIHARLTLLPFLLSVTCVREEPSNTHQVIIIILILRFTKSKKISVLHGLRGK